MGEAKHTNEARPNSRTVGRRKWARSFLAVALCVVVVVPIACHFAVSRRGTQTTAELADLGARPAALVLGTSRTLSDGRPNLYYAFRIEAALALFRAGKCEKIVVSGDNGTVDYNEPEDMKADLVARGVPADCIVCDYAGFRTLDSVIRFKEVFGQTGGIVVSQRFHNERAIFIGQAHGIDLVGFNAQDVTFATGFKTRTREVVSRVACVLDVHVFGTKPKYLGEPVQL